MTTAGILALLIGAMAAMYVSFRQRSGVYFVLFVAHLAAALFYWQFTLVRVSDAWGYYNWSDASGDFGAGSWVIGVLTAFLRDSWQASYVDCFMIYHLAGLIGVMGLCGLTRELFPDASRLSLGIGRIAHCAIFMPGVHVWTSGIGKDSVMFMAIVAVIWGVYRPRERVAATVAGLAVCAAVRPHVAALLIASLAAAVASTNQLRLGWKLFVLAFSLAALAVSLPFLLNFVGLQATDAGSISSYIEQRQGYNLEGGSSVDISDYPFPLQFFTYMYRPLFFDASSGISLIVSFENLLYLSATLLWGNAALRAIWSESGSVFLRFNFLFWLFSTSLFAMTTANLGIAVRQKTGILPSFFLLVLAAYDWRSRRLAGLRKGRALATDRALKELVSTQPARFSHASIMQGGQGPKMASPPSRLS